MADIPKRPRGRHGGKREGAGRPRLGPGTVVVAVTLTARHLGKVERWQEAHDLASFSAALRAMIDVAAATT